MFFVEVDRQMKKLSALKESIINTSAHKSIPSRYAFVSAIASKVLPTGAKLLFLEIDLEDYLTKYQSVM